MTEDLEVLREMEERADAAALDGVWSSTDMVGWGCKLRWMELLCIVMCNVVK